MSGNIGQRVIENTQDVTHWVRKTLSYQYTNTETMGYLMIISGL